MAHNVVSPAMRAKMPPTAEPDEEEDEADEEEAAAAPPEASPSAPTATTGPPKIGGLPSRGLRSRVPRPGAKAPRPVPKDQAGAPTLDSDTKRVKRAGPSKIRRETDTEVKSPQALSSPTPAAKPLDDDQTDLRPGKPSPFDSAPAAPASPAVPPAQPAAAKLPDKTAAMPSIPDSSPSGPGAAPGNGQPFDPEAEIRAASEAALAAMERRKYTSNRPATAEALFEEDEDGPTMVAPIPAEVNRAPPQGSAAVAGRAAPARPVPFPPDDEQTAVHPYRLPKQPVTQPPPALGASLPSVPPMSAPAPVSIPQPQPREMVPTAPPPIVNPAPQELSPVSADPVQAAFDAASVMPLEARLIAERKARSYDTIAASILGFGMITATLASYLAAGVPEKTAGYFGVVALTSVAMFLVGMGPIQKRNETKITFIALGGVMLLFTLIRLLFVAI